MKAHNRLDLTNKKFDYLFVIEYARKNKHQKSLWSCWCICGNFFISLGADIVNSKIKSCGCFRKAVLAKNYKEKHGHARRQNHSKAYHSWADMKKRCLNKKSWAYGYYGGRGIKICKRWLTFTNFLKDMGEPPKGLTLDRINNDGNYGLKNCRWATRKQQSQNRRMPWKK